MDVKERITMKLWIYLVYNSCELSWSGRHVIWQSFMATESDGKKEAEIAEYRAKVLKVIESEGEVDKIQHLISNLVGESSWRDAVKKMCNKKMDQESIEELTPELVTQMIIQDAINAIPKTITSAVDKHIRDVLTKKKVPVEQPNQRK